MPRPVLIEVEHNQASASQPEGYSVDGQGRYDRDEAITIARQIGAVYNKHGKDARLKIIDPPKRKVARRLAEEAFAKTR